jgi:hypothetical protein
MYGGTQKFPELSSMSGAPHGTHHRARIFGKQVQALLLCLKAALQAEKCERLQ